MNRLIVAVTIFAALGVGPVAVAGPLKGHPNMKAAEKALDNCHNKLVAAQQANEWDLAGHAQKAKQLIEEAKHEIVLAAEKANNNARNR